MSYYTYILSLPLLPKFSGSTTNITTRNALITEGFTDEKLKKNCQY